MFCIHFHFIHSFWCCWWWRRRRRLTNSTSINISFLSSYQWTKLKSFCMFVCLFIVVGVLTSLCSLCASCSFYFVSVYNFGYASTWQKTSQLFINFKGYMNWYQWFYLLKIRIKCKSIFARKWKWFCFVLFWNIFSSLKV